METRAGFPERAPLSVSSVRSNVANSPLEANREGNLVTLPASVGGEASAYGEASAACAPPASSPPVSLVPTPSTELKSRPGAGEVAEWLGSRDDTATSASGATAGQRSEDALAGIEREDTEDQVAGVASSVDPPIGGVELQPHDEFELSPEERLSRLAMALRLASYVSGELPSLSAPRYYAQRPWSEQSHAFMPPVFRHIVWLLLLQARRLQEGDAGYLPTELWVLILRHCHRDWFVPPRLPIAADVAHA